MKMSDLVRGRRGRRRRGDRGPAIDTRGSRGPAGGHRCERAERVRRGPADGERRRGGRGGIARGHDHAVERLGGDVHLGGPAVVLACGSGREPDHIRDPVHAQGAAERGRAQPGPDRHRDVRLVQLVLGGSAAELGDGGAVAGLGPDEPPCNGPGQPSIVEYGAYEVSATP
jgi:hypothetical protein